MKESEYILSTNLAKIRMALEIIKDTLPDKILSEDVRFNMIKKLSILTDKYYSEIDKKLNPKK